MAKYTVVDTQTGKMVTFDWEGTGEPTDADMEQVFSQARQMPIQAPMSTVQQPQQTEMQQAAAKIAPYARTALEMGGMLAGGALAAPVAPPIGALGGAGLGYAAGRQMANALDVYAGRRAPTTTGQNILAAAKDIPIGATMEAGGAVLGYPLQRGLQAAAKIAPRLYESVAKIPPRSVPKTIRESAVKTALEQEIPATQKGYEKLSNIIGGVNREISQTIAKAQKSGDVIQTKDILSNARQGIMNWAKKTGQERTSPILKAFDEYADDIVREHGETMAVADAQQMKSGIYRRLSERAYLPGADDALTMQREFSKKFASGIRQELIRKYPVLENLGMKDRSLIRLQNILERTVNRTRNWDIAGLTDIAGAGVGTAAGMVESGGDLRKGGLGAATGYMLARGLRSPAVMSQLAFALNKASKKAGQGIGSKLASYGIIKATGIPEAEELVGNVLNKITPGVEAAMLPAPGMPMQRDITGLPVRKEIPQMATTQQMAPEQIMMPTEQQVPQFREKPPHPMASPAYKLERKAVQMALNAYNNMSLAQYDAAIAIFKKAQKKDPQKADKYQLDIETLKREKEAIREYKKTNLWNLPSIARVSRALETKL